MQKSMDKQTNDNDNKTTLFRRIISAQCIQFQTFNAAEPLLTIQ
jgi:hypothetical protein